MPQHNVVGRGYRRRRKGRAAEVAKNIALLTDIRSEICGDDPSDETERAARDNSLAKAERVVSDVEALSPRMDVGARSRRAFMAAMASRAMINRAVSEA